MTEIKRLENLFNTLTEQAAISRSAGKDTYEIDKQCNSVLEEIIERRRNIYNDQFRLNMDNYDY